jgi:hypothetical protein
MHLIDGAGHENNTFVAEDIPTSRPPTEITADIMNALQFEIANFILSAGESLNKASNTQLRDALHNTFARSNNTIHYLGQIYNIVADQATLELVATEPLPEGTQILVTSYYGLHQAAMATWINGAWADTPVPLKVFDLYATTYDNHGYYWFANTWNLFDVATMQVDEATETGRGIVRLATWAEVLAGSLAAVALRPRHMQDYMDSMFIGSISDFSGTTPPSNVWLPLQGQLIPRTQRPRLWDYAQASGNIVADGSWSGQPGRFSTGNGTTTFRLPDLRGEFRRGWDGGRGIDAGRAFGTMQPDQFRAHSHEGVPLRSTDSDRGGSSSFFSVDDFGQTGSTGGTETRPRNIAYLTCIYAGAPA